jgi:hypothetical protein
MDLRSSYFEGAADGRGAGAPCQTGPAGFVGRRRPLFYVLGFMK